jgi:DNA replication protein DnaC
MSNEATIEKMNRLKLSGMLNAYKQYLETSNNSKLTVDEIISHLIDAEWEDRYNRKIKRLIKSAKFRYQGCIEQIDYTSNRNLDKSLMIRLSECNWIRKKENIIITGPTGVGKSYISSTLGHQACLCEYRVLYFNCNKLFDLLKISKVDGSYSRLLTRIQKQDLLILDDFGIHPIDGKSRLFLLELLEDRHGLKSTVITSQIPIKNWFDIIDDATIADAICDRIVHKAIRIELKGESLRKKDYSGQKLPLNL